MFRSILRVILCTAALPAVAADQVDLMGIYMQALEADPRVKIAEQKIAIGQARSDGRFAQLLPQATLFANVSDNAVEFPENDNVAREEYDGQRYSLQVRQMLFDWSKLSAQTQAEQVVEQYEAEYLDVLSLMLVDVAERYFNVLLADNDLKLIRDERGLVEEQLRQIDEMYQRKLVSITDLLETQARADEVRTDEIEAENNAAIRRETLAELTGSHVGNVAGMRAEFDLPELNHSMEYWTDLAIAGNKALRAKREAVEAAEKAVQQQKGGHYPTADLVFSVQDSDIGYDNQVSPRRETQYIGIDVVLPLYSGGSTSAAVREAWALYYTAREEEEATRREITRRTRESWLNSRSSRKRIDSVQLNVVSATKSYAAMNKSFTYGTVTATDVLAALHAQTRARRDYQNALYSFIVNWLALKRESGQLAQDDLQQVNSWLVAPAG